MQFELCPATHCYARLALLVVPVPVLLRGLNAAADTPKASLFMPAI